MIIQGIQKHLVDVEVTQRTLIEELYRDWLRSIGVQSCYLGVQSCYPREHHHFYKVEWIRVTRESYEEETIREATEEEARIHSAFDLLKKTLKD